MVAKKQLASARISDSCVCLRYEYIGDRQEFAEFEIPEDETEISFSFDPQDSKYHMVTYVPKLHPITTNQNFIFELRKLTEQNKDKKFSYKYPLIAQQCIERAKLGFNSCFLNLNKDEIESLRAEGFEITEVVGTTKLCVTW